jgi:hypothetical protein
VHRTNLFDRQLAYDGIDVTTEDAFDDFRVSVVGSNVALHPELAQPDHVVPVDGFELLFALFGGNVNTLLNLGPVVASQFASVLQRDVRITANHFFLVSAGEPITQYP